MRIAMITLGSEGDVRPFLVMGRELKKRGYDVTIGAFGRFRERAEQSGLEFYPIAGNAEEFINRIMSPVAKGVAYLTELEKAIGSVAPDILKDITALCERSDALICNFFGSMYYSAAEHAKIPCIQIHYTLMDSNDLAPISSAPGQDWGVLWKRFSYRLGYYLISVLEKKYLTGWR